jgi:hypothetical protein
VLKNFVPLFPVCLATKDGYSLANLYRKLQNIDCTVLLMILDTRHGQSLLFLPRPAKCDLQNLPVPTLPNLKLFLDTDMCTVYHIYVCTYSYSFLVQYTE